MNLSGIEYQYYVPIRTLRSVNLATGNSLQSFVEMMEDEVNAIVESGYCRELSEFGIHEFVNIKKIVVQ